MSASRQAITQRNKIIVPPECHVQPLSKLSEKWNNMLNALLEFKEKHGHCLVPNRYHENPQLGAWVSVQRRQYKDLQRGEPSAMTVERAKLLESIGFKWSSKDPRNVPWKTRYEELKEYRQQHGDCLVPFGWEENPQLGVWVSMQREAYKLKMENKANGISDEKIMKLNSIGFVWESQDEKMSSNQNSTTDNSIYDETKPPITTSDGISPQELSQNSYVSTSAGIPQAQINGPFSNSPQHFHAHPASNQHQAELMYKLAQIQAMEDAVRMSMNRSMVQAQQAAPHGNPPSNYPYNNNMAKASPPKVFLVGDDGQLIYKDHPEGSYAMTAPPTQVRNSSELYKNMQAASYHMKSLPFMHNQDISKLPSLKEYSASSANACRVVTDESIEYRGDTRNFLPYGQDDDRLLLAERKKNSSKRASFISCRYPGPQTSDAFWWARFAELKKFREENGHCIVPNRYPPHPPLGNWVSTQRRQYKLWKNGKVSSMNEERAKALEGIGFSWVVRSAYNMSIDMKMKKEESETIDDVENKDSENDTDASIDEDKKSDINYSVDVTFDSNEFEGADADVHVVGESYLEIKVPIPESSIPVPRETKKPSSSKEQGVEKVPPKRKAVELPDIDEDYFPYENKVQKKCETDLNDSLKGDAFSGPGVREVRLSMNGFRRHGVANSSDDYEEKDEDPKEGVDASTISDTSVKVKRYF